MKLGIRSNFGGSSGRDHHIADSNKQVESCEKISARHPASIVFFDEAVAFGGSVVVLSHLFKYIDRARFRPRLVTSLDAGSIEKLFDSEDILCWFRPTLDYSDRVRWMSRCPWPAGIARKSWAYSFIALASIANLPQVAHLYFKVWKSRPALAHVNNGETGLQVSRFLRIPLLAHLHGIAADMVERACRPRRPPTTFVSVSKYIAEEAVKIGVSASRISCVPNPAPQHVIDESKRIKWRARFNLSPDVIVFAHIGRLVYWKGQLEFIEAFSRITAQCPNAHALIVGDDVENLSNTYPAELRELVKRKRLEDRVTFTGHIEDILGLMSAAEVVVHSSIEPEPFGLVITEAMAAGAAVIAARLGAPVEIVDDGENGLLVDPSNVKEFSVALIDLATNKARRDMISAAGKVKTRTQYSPESFARQIEAIYESTIANAGRG